MYKHLHESIESNVFFRKTFLLWKLFCFKRIPKHYGQYGEDVVIDRFLDIKTPGFFVDVGCFHPIKYNNTFKLYKHGWRGINIDLDSIKIEGFQLRRPSDCNITAAISDKEETVKHFSFGFYALTSSIDRAFTEELIRDGKHCKVSEIKTRTLDNVIESTEYAGRQIDLLSVDVEGHDLSVLQSLSFETYQPKLIMVELHQMGLTKIMESDIYTFLKSRGYELANWMGPTLLWIHSPLLSEK